MKETVPASRKLQVDDARAMLARASLLVVAKGKKIRRFSLGGGATDEAVEAMLGPTGNLRAPTVRIGKTLLVGFNEDVFDDTLTTA